MPTIVLDLVAIECFQCHVTFGVTRYFDEQRRRGDQPQQIDFWCPNGHSQRYSRLEIDRLRSEKEALERRLANARDDLNVERASHSATKGQITKLKKRVAAGVCPFCHRHFVGLEKHVQSKHPEEHGG